MRSQPVPISAGLWHVVTDCTRAVVGQLIAVGSTGQQGARVLEQLRAHRPLPPLVVCDHGPELTSTALFFWAISRQVRLGFMQLGKPTQNALVESLTGKLRHEGCNLHWFRSLEAARREIT